MRVDGNDEQVHLPIIIDGQMYGGLCAGHSLLDGYLVAVQFDSIVLRILDYGVAKLATMVTSNISNELLVSRSGNVGTALQDIWWAVLNTNEFILIH